MGGILNHFARWYVEKPFPMGGEFPCCFLEENLLPADPEQLSGGGMQEMMRSSYFFVYGFIMVCLQTATPESAGEPSVSH